MIKSDLVRAMNESYAKLQLNAVRVEELPIELEQLRRALEAVNDKVDFDIDPFDFRAALLDVASGSKDDLLVESIACRNCRRDCGRHDDRA